MTITAKTETVHRDDFFSFTVDTWSDGYVCVTLNDPKGFVQYQADSKIHPSEARDGSDTKNRLIGRILDEYVFPNKY